MTSASSDIEARINRAWERFLARHSKPLQLDASERSMAHKLAEHLQLEFPGGNVDRECNRGERPPRSLALSKGPHGKGDLRPVFPDIVIYKGCTKDDLVAIDAKKSTSRHNERDSCKLHAYHESPHYQYAYLVVFPIGMGDKRELVIREHRT